MEQKKGIIVLMSAKFSFSIVQSSRALYIFRKLKEELPDTYIIMENNEDEEIGLDNLIKVRPIIPISGKFRLFKGMLFKLQMTFLSIKHIISKRIDYAILRGYDTILLYPFLKILRIKIYMDYHGIYKHELDQQDRHLRAFIVGHIERLSLHLADRIIVVSEGVITQIQEHKDKCIYLPNGIDVNTINSTELISPVDLPDNKRIVGFVGNWEEFMRIDDVCESLKYLDNCIGVIVGEGYQAERVMEKYGSYENLIFTGRIQREEVYALLHKFDVCILPYDKNDRHSRYPDYFSSRKAKEYIAAGKPIVTSDVLGRESWLIDRQTCLLYDSGDPEDLAEKIDMLLSNEELYATICRNNKELSRKFTWDTLVDESGLIDDILS